MKCPNCGTANDNNETTCKICGNLLENTLEPTETDIIPTDNVTAEDNENNNTNTEDNTNNNNSEHTSYQNPEYNNQGYQDNQQYQQNNQEYGQNYNQGYQQGYQQDYNQNYQQQNYNQGYQQQNYNQNYQQQNYNQGYQQSQPRSPASRKSNALGLIIGFFIGGAGMCYANKWGEGIIYFIIIWFLNVLGFLTLGLAFIPAIIVWIYSLVKTNQYIDAYNRGEYY